MGKIRVEELALQMGIGSKEVLFLLQSIGVDVKSPQAALDESTVLAILQGKTHAPKQLIVRDSESKAFRPQKSALSRIKIVEKPLLQRAEPEPVRGVGVGDRTRCAAARRPVTSSPAAARASPCEDGPKPPARTAVVPTEPEAEPTKPPAPQDRASAAETAGASASGPPSGRPMGPGAPAGAAWRAPGMPVPRDP